MSLIIPGTLSASEVKHEAKMADGCEPTRLGHLRPWLRGPVGGTDVLYLPAMASATSPPCPPHPLPFPCSTNAWSPRAAREGLCDPRFLWSMGGRLAPCRQVPWTSVETTKPRTSLSQSWVTHVPSVTLGK